MKLLRDYPLAGTPFRALILQGPFSLLAYIGVPQSHWLADMDELEFRCHWGVTFRGAGEGGVRPQGWFWYGWDYGHAWDALTLDEGFERAMAELPQEMQDAMRSLMQRPGAKQWTVAEVEHDLTEAALSLLESLQDIEAHVASLASKVQEPGPEGGPSA